MPTTSAVPATAAAGEAANGGHYDHDRGTKYEGLIHELPHFRSSPMSRLTHSGRYELTRGTAPSTAAQRAIRRNTRKLDRRFGPKGRGRAGILGLLDAVKKPDPTAEPLPAA